MLRISYNFVLFLFIRLLHSKISFVALLLCYVLVVCPSLMDLCRRPLSETVWSSILVSTVIFSHIIIDRL